MTGRPSSYTEELGELICALLADGKSLNKICQLDSMPCRATVMSWLAQAETAEGERYKSFLDKYLRAREFQADTIFDECLDIADNKGSDIKKDAAGLPVFDEAGNPVIDHDNIQRAKLQIDTRMRMAGKLKPKKYGDKQIIAGDADAPVAHTFGWADPK